MSFDKTQFRRLVQQVLKELEPMITYSRAAEELLLLTAAQETHLGTYLEQIKGPAKGVFQMEPKTWRDIEMNFLFNQPDLHVKVEHFYAHCMNYELNATANLAFQIVQARIFYWRIPAVLPFIRTTPSGDVLLVSVVALAAYWKKYWNTHLGRGTVDQAVQNYGRFVA